MAKRRKHRVVVDITLEQPSTEKRATEVVYRALANNRSDTWREEVTTWQTKSYSRVVNYLRSTIWD